VPTVKRHPPLRIKATPTFTHPGQGFQGLLIFSSPLVRSRTERLLQIPESVAAALDVDDVGVVQQAVETGRGQHLVTGQELAPVARTLVGGDQRKRDQVLFHA